MNQKHSIIRKCLLAILLGVANVVNAQKTYIVCVGVGANNSSSELEELPNPVIDMRAISKFYNNYNGAKPFVLLDDNATRSHILKVLKQEFSKSTPNDEIIFAYSGHGHPDGFVATYNFRDREFLFCSEVQEIMLKAKARRKMMFVNSCHSGTFTLKYNDADKKRPKYNKSSKVLLFLSSRADEPSWSLSESNKRSLFYHFLIKGLRGEADKSGDRKVTARELFNYVAQNVEYTSKYFTEEGQHPVMWGQFPDDMVIVYVK